MADYREVQIWQEEKARAVQVYKLTHSEACTKDWVLRDQFRRAAVGVASNFAEGEARTSQQDSPSASSRSPSAVWLNYILKRRSRIIGYLSTSDHYNLQHRAAELEWRAGALIKARKSRL